MKASWIPAMIFAAVCAGFLIYLSLTASQLPGQVASHFNGAGRADGWMTRASYVRFIAVFAIGLPLFVVGVFFLLRFVPNGLINMPRRDYWLAPERRSETFACLFRHSFWLASMTVGLNAGLHTLILEANRQGPAAPRLSTVPALALLACFLAGVAVWSICLIRRFR